MVVVSVSLMIIAVLLWIVCAIGQVIIIANRKPAIKLFEPRLLFNPFFLQFGGRYLLTEKGIFWRNVSWTCCILFGVLWMVIVVIS